MQLLSVISSASLLLSGLVAAHPGADHAKEAAERRDFLATRGKTDLKHCAAKLKERGLAKRAALRRKDMVDSLVQKRGLKKRQYESLTISHASDAEYDADTDFATIFAGNNSCVLSPETTEGPYYVSGETIRQDVTEDQTGVPLTIDVQVLDTETCEPVSDVYMEMWHCNSTGVYGGVLAGGNGNTADETNLQNTWLRGIQLTDSDGAVQFHTTFPGHYRGRTTHIHVMVHQDATPAENGTIINTKATHVGQMFFDQDLIYAVEELAPYKENAQPLLTNVRDAILWQESSTSDPFMEYVMVGDKLEDGLFAWLAFGVDKAASRTINAASTVYKDGAVQNARQGGPGGMMPGMPGAGGAGRMPGGAVPSAPAEPAEPETPGDGEGEAE